MSNNDQPLGVILYDHRYFSDVSIFHLSLTQGLPMDRPPGVSREGGKLRGGLAGQPKTLHRKKFHFCIIQTILNKISKKKFRKSLDLAIFVNFADLHQGDRGYHPPTPYGDPWFNLFCTEPT